MMKRIFVEKRFLLCAVVLAMTCACNPDNESLERSGKFSTSFLPLEVGNYWDFKSVHSTNGEIVMHREVKGTKQLNGHEYYLLTSQSPQSNTIIDSVYYRIEANGDVYTYRRTMGIEELKYKLFANDGDTWSYPFIDDDVMDVTLHLGKVDTENKTVEDCRNYYFDVPGWADEEHTNSLAVGVGFIREYSNAWNSGMVLSKASIGGSVIDF